MYHDDGSPITALSLLVPLYGKRLYDLGRVNRARLRGLSAARRREPVRLGKLEPEPRDIDGLGVVLFVETENQVPVGLSIDTHALKGGRLNRR